MKADLHMHSAWSDGSMKVKEIVKTAKRTGLQVISITDHDSMKGQAEVARYGEKYGVTIIPGIEISSYNPENGRKVHILGYHIQNQSMVNDRLLPFLQERHDAALKAVDIIMKAGYPIELDDVTCRVGSGDILYRQHIMYALMERGYTNSIYGELYQKLFGKEGIAKVTSSYIPVKEAVELVLEAGGIPVLAHPFQYDTFDLIPRLKQWGIQGVEYKHHTQTKEREEAVLKAAKELELFVTGGSDCHGIYSEKPCPYGGTGYEMEENHPLLRYNRS